MTILKFIGSFSIESKRSTIEKCNEWFGILDMVGFVAVIGSFFYPSAILLTGHPDLLVLGVGIILCVVGFIGLSATTRQVPAFEIALHGTNGKIKTYCIEATKDLDEMTKRTQEIVDTLTVRANEEIKRIENEEKTKMCMNNLEKEIVGRLK